MKNLTDQLKDKVKEIDQQSVQVVNQAIKDDQSLDGVASTIRVTVKDGEITLDGKASTPLEVNLASNTAKAVGVVDIVKNHIEISPHKPL